MQDELEREPSINASEIGVTAHDGVVTLTGLVPSYAEKLAAARTAKRIPGVTAIANDIELRRSRTPTYAEIAWAAFEALKGLNSRPHARLDVTVTNDWAYLQGEVDSQRQKIAAEEAVHFLVGVKGVMNPITVGPKVSASDFTASEVKSRIGAAFRPSAELDAETLRVQCKNGNVTLHGQLRS